MDLRIFTEPQQGASYDQQLRLARHAEALGYDAFFRSDHYLRMGPGDPSPGPTDAWLTLAGLARETDSIRLGTLVTSATFRHPGPLAVGVAQVDAMSGGRVELGLGAGWFEQEHTAHGIPFPPIGERFDRLEEQLRIITGFLATPPGGTFDDPGPTWPVVASPALPKPVQSRVPVIVGGKGLRRTPAIAARHADEFNVSFMSLEETVERNEALERACERIDRDPATLVRSAAQVLCCGADDAEVARRAAAIGREPPELIANGMAGTPGQVAAKLSAFRDAGITRVYLQVLDMDDLAHLELVAAEVAPRLA